MNSCPALLPERESSADFSPAVSPQANICRAYSAKTGQFNLQNSYHVTSVSKVVRLV